MYYFAYGSNLNQRQMAERCPAASPKFRATLPGYELVFMGWSRTWGGAVASVRPRKNGKVLGGVYEVSEADLASLDQYEGYPTVYNRVNLNVLTEGCQAIEVMTYVKVERGAEGRPSRKYLLTIREGYEQWGMDQGGLPMARSQRVAKGSGAT